MAFARAVGEIGSIILITGNLPFKTEVASVFIFQRIDGDPHGAAAVSVVLLAISFVVLLARRRSPALRDEARPWRKYGDPRRRARLPADHPARPARDDDLAHARGLGRAPGSAITDPNTIDAFKLTLLVTAIAVPVNTVFGIVCGLAIVRKRFRGRGLVNAFVDLPLALSPVIVGLSLVLLYGANGWFGFLPEHGYRGAVRDCRRSCSRRSSSRSRSSRAR